MRSIISSEKSVVFMRKFLYGTKTYLTFLGLGEKWVSISTVFQDCLEDSCTRNVYHLCSLHRPSSRSNFPAQKKVMRAVISGLLSIIPELSELVTLSSLLNLNINKKEFF